MKSIELLEELTQLNGAPGYEHQVRDYMKKKLSKYSDEIICDNLGSIFAVKKSKNENAPVVMFAGHMDEVGFMITNVNEYGLLKFHTLGGWWSQVLLAQKVVIETKNGPIRGVISSISPHLLTDEQKSKPMDMDNMLIDCGFIDKEDALKHIAIGDFAVPYSTFEKLANNRVVAKAFDNRYGCALAIDILKSLKDVELDCHLYIGATVQEETGLRGATTAANLIKPDIFIAADASPARDMSGAKSELGRLGEGFLVRILDRTMILSPKMQKYALSIADKNKIKYQYFTSPGGTDAGAVHLSNNGVPSIVVGIPARGIHSHTSIIDMNDYDCAKKMVLALLKDINSDTLGSLR